MKWHGHPVAVNDVMRISTFHIRISCEAGVGGLHIKEQGWSSDCRQAWEEGSEEGGEGRVGGYAGQRMGRDEQELGVQLVFAAQTREQGWW